jgi:hypothetical protein
LPNPVEAENLTVIALAGGGGIGGIGGGGTK